ncbi:negative cofactor 2 complex subunit alpha [Monosporozyma servazzii]
MEVGRGNIVLQDLLTNDMPPPAALEEQQQQIDENVKMEEVFGRIKTHFPPAKIKKIMQTDEDIGKVSQATPVIVGRSLEYFMAMLVEQSGEMARGMNTKRITADIVKKTIMENEKFDFLRENFGIEEEELEQEQEQEQGENNDN